MELKTDIKGVVLNSIVLFFLVVPLFVSCGGYRVRLVNTEQENFTNRDIEDIKEKQADLSKNIIELGGVGRDLNDEKKNIAVVTNKIAVLDDKVSGLVKDADQNSVDVNIIQRRLTKEDKVNLEFRELASELSQKSQKNRSYISEYQDEAVNLRGDLMNLDDKVEKLIAKIDKLTSLESDIEGVSSSQNASKLIVTKSINKINENAKAIGTLTKLMKALGRKVSSSLDAQTGQIKDLQSQIVSINVQLDKIAKESAELKANATLRSEQEKIRATSPVTSTKSVEKLPDSTADLVPDDGVKQPNKKVVEPSAKDEKKDSSSELNLYENANSRYLKAEYDGAIIHFEKFLKAHPDSNMKLDAMYKLGRALFEKKELSASLEMFEKIINFKGNNGNNMVPTALLRKSIIFLELGERDKAKVSLREVIDRFPSKKEAESAKEILAKIAQ